MADLSNIATEGGDQLQSPTMDVTVSTLQPAERAQIIQSQLSKINNSLDKMKAMSNFNQMDDSTLARYTGYTRKQSQLPARNQLKFQAAAQIPDTMDRLAAYYKQAYDNSDLFGKPILSNLTPLTKTNRLGIENPYVNQYENHVADSLGNLATVFGGGGGNMAHASLELYRNKLPSEYNDPIAAAKMFGSSRAYAAGQMKTYLETQEAMGYNMQGLRKIMIANGLLDEKGNPMPANQYSEEYETFFKNPNDPKVARLKALFSTADSSSGTAAMSIPESQTMPQVQCTNVVAPVVQP